jgi:endonuclease YncB( thermonuclease family)
MRTATPWVIVCALLALGAETACVPQERVNGRAEIIDGDSFRIGSAEIRLFGADAPEGRQQCTRNGSPWRCGDAAASELRRLTVGRDVVCMPRDKDDYGRIVATCRAGNVDLAGAMVSAGFAVAYRRYSDDYVDEESAARGAKRGVWAGEFERPEEFRRDGREERAAQAPPAARAPPRTAQRAGCNIKGNVNTAGERIYHTPSSASYDDTRIDERNGERWFCSEAEARAAGWRAPR